MINAQLTLAEIDGWHVMLQHNLRHLCLSRDRKTCDDIASRLGDMLKEATQAASDIRRGANWQIYCQTCTFELPPNTRGIMMCRTCGERLKYWNLEYGEIRR